MQRHHARPPLRACAVTVGLAALLSACAPAAVTEQGGGVRWLYDVFLIVAAVVFGVVSLLIAWSILRYRDRPGLPVQTHGNVLLELIWWAIPTALVVVLFVLSAGAHGTVTREVTEPAVTVRVQGFQWQWRFVYEGRGVEIVGVPGSPPEIMLPVGQPVAFLLESPDVIHSFYVPRFLLKEDVNPGVQNRIDVTISEEGTYTGQCAEFCGLLHDEMTFTITAVQRDRFEAWLAEQGEADR